MSMEFTGERVIPGRVDVDLWNEHIARYAFAAQFSSGARVLDAGCGAGYGSSLLAGNARLAVGFDIAIDAVHHACAEYAAANVRWLQASSAQLPFKTASFDLVVAFEVIEHLPDWPNLLDEAQRVLADTGVFIVSTPNKAFYAESRLQSGPNPYHEHEFEYPEFLEALSQRFRHVQIAFQNHSECVLFDVPEKHSGASYVEQAGAPDDANFFVAVCSAQPVTLKPFAYFPRAANVLRERADHIHRLEQELGTKNQWLSEAQAQHAALVQLHDEQTQALKASNTWAQGLQSELDAAQQRVVILQGELEDRNRAYEELHRAFEARTEQLERSANDLAQCVKLLDTAEATVVERTNWALDLQRQLEETQARLAGVQASRWVKLGRKIRLGPELDT